MSISRNKAALRRIYEEVFNKGNLEIIPELISEDFVFTDSPIGEHAGPNGFKGMVAMTRKAFPDIKMKVIDMVAEGDKLAVYLNITGTFTGEFAGHQPTGKKFSLTAAYFYRFKDAKEAEVRPVDPNAFFRALGITS